VLGWEHVHLLLYGSLSLHMLAKKKRALSLLP
jgi:hypothetical protein